jgi:chromosome segregation ATPase
MNTYTITIGALALIGTGTSIALTLKYLQLKAYFRTEQAENTKLRDSNVEQQERINVLSKQLETYKNSDQEKTIQKLYAEISDKNAKILRKNKLIQSQADQLTSLENDHNDLIVTHSMAGEKLKTLQNIQNYLQDRLKKNKQFQQVIRDLEGGSEC